MGRANIILDNLIAKGKAKPMIVVMPNGNATQTVSQGYAYGPTPHLKRFRRPHLLLCKPLQVAARGARPARPRRRRSPPGLPRSTQVLIRRAW